MRARCREYPQPKTTGKSTPARKTSSLRDRYVRLINPPLHPNTTSQPCVTFRHISLSKRTLCRTEVKSKTQPEHPNYMRLQILIYPKEIARAIMKSMLSLCVLLLFDGPDFGVEGSFGDGCAFLVICFAIRLPVLEFLCWLICKSRSASREHRPYWP